MSWTFFSVGHESKRQVAHRATGKVVFSTTLSQLRAMKRRSLLQTLGLTGLAVAGMSGSVGATSDGGRIDLVGTVDPRIVERITLPGPGESHLACFNERVGVLEPGHIDRIHVDGGVENGDQVIGQILVYGEIPADELAATMADDPAGFERAPVHTPSLEVYRTHEWPLVVGFDRRRILLRIDSSQAMAFNRFRELTRRPREGFRPVPDRLREFDHAIAIGMNRTGRQQAVSHGDALSTSARRILGQVTGIGLGITLSAGNAVLRYVVSSSGEVDITDDIQTMTNSLDGDERVSSVAVSSENHDYVVDITLRSGGVTELHKETFLASERGNSVTPGAERKREKSEVE